MCSAEVQEKIKTSSVLQVHKSKVVQDVSEDIINQGLEHCWGAVETERHDQVLEFALVCRSIAQELCVLNRPAGHNSWSIYLLHMTFFLQRIPAGIITGK